MAIALALIAVCTALEQIIPRVRKRTDRSKEFGRILRNLSFGVIHRLIVAPFILAPLVLLATPLPSLQSKLGVVSFLVSFLLLDFTNYFTHWLGHRVPFFWRFHSVHHLDNHLDVTTGLRVHAFERILLLPVKLGVIVAFGIPLRHVAWVEAITFCNGILHHSNVRLPRALEAALSWVITVPAFHGVHHHSELPDTDSNYGFVLTVWDRLFGTLSRREPDRGVVAGVNGRVLERVPESFNELFFQPFVGPLAGTTVEE